MNAEMLSNVVDVELIYDGVKYSLHVSFWSVGAHSALPFPPPSPSSSSLCLLLFHFPSSFTFPPLPPPFPFSRPEVIIPQVPVILFPHPIFFTHYSFKFQINPNIFTHNSLPNSLPKKKLIPRNTARNADMT